MEINIKTQTLLEELRQKSHLGTERIKDAEVREAVRAGKEKTDELTRCIMTADSRLRAVIGGRYLKRDHSTAADDMLGLPDYLTYDLLINVKRASGKDTAFAGLFHDYLVNMALSRYYVSVAMADMAGARAALAAQDEKDIIILLNTKLPPV